MFIFFEVGIRDYHKFWGVDWKDSQNFKEGYG